MTRDRRHKGTRRKRLRVVCVDDHAYLGSTANGTPCAPPPDERLDDSLTIGKVDEVISERLGMYAIIDGTGESYLFPKSRFRILENGKEEGRSSKPR